MTVSWHWFSYVLLGFILGGSCVYLLGLLKEKSVKLLWYEWILIILSFLLALFMGQTFIASFAELQPRAAWLSLVFMGLPVLIMAVGAYRSIKART